jgi:hypothetical protein
MSIFADLRLDVAEIDGENAGSNDAQRDMQQFSLLSWTALRRYKLFRFQKLGQRLAEIASVEEHLCEVERCCSNLITLAIALRLSQLSLQGMRGLRQSSI